MQGLDFRESERVRTASKAVAVEKHGYGSIADVEVYMFNEKQRTHLFRYRFL
jgi:hypothetical protein